MTMMFRVIARAGSPKMCGSGFLPRAVAAVHHAGPGEEVDREVHRQAERQAAEHRHGHVVVLADQADRAVDRRDGHRQRDHAQQAPQHRAEQDDHQQQHDQEAAQERLQHAGDHLVLPDHVDVRQAEPLKADVQRRRVVGRELADDVDDLLHVAVVAAGQLDPDAGVLEVWRHEVPDVLRAVGVSVLLNAVGDHVGVRRHAVGVGGPAEQVALDRADEIGDRVALSDHLALGHGVLEADHPVQHGRVLEDLRLLADLVDQQADGIVGGREVGIALGHGCRGRAGGDDGQRRFIAARRARRQCRLIAGRSAEGSAAHHRRRAARKSGLVSGGRTCRQRRNIFHELHPRGARRLRTLRNVRRACIRL